MPSSRTPTLHCHRCIYSWQPRGQPPQLCPRCKSRLWRVAKIRPKPIHPRGLGVAEVIGPKRAELHRLARRYRVRSLRVFGSVARGEADATSDVDLLFDSNLPMSLLARVELRMSLERLLGRRVDLLREGELKWSVRPQVLADALPL
jgi:uncharacterized protein